MTSHRHYYLLTGATGLLGRYLLRNLLLRDIPVAVVVRGTRLASAKARVESLLVEIEQSLGRELPRPMVLTGELTEPGLGLSLSDLDWARHNVAAILHNAASLTFDKAERHEEPWLSNVTGTQNVLDLSRELGVRKFHHVSTAYVCGQRRGRILESELDVGQAFGNDYEASKLEAETLVRAAAWLDGPTIYRPAIIVGDSRTGFSNTFHGFYTPLQIAHSMINKLRLSEVEPRSLIDILGLTGDEKKNLVSVDWVAAVIAHLVGDRRHHGLTYHLTPREATPIALLCDVFSEAVLHHSIDLERAASPAAVNGQSFASFQRLFHSQMAVYQAYWRDDPVFDAANMLAHAPHLPSPALDRATLLMLCKFAIDHNFWWSRGTEQAVEIDIEAELRSRLEPTKGINGAAHLNLYLTGPGGGAWRLWFHDGRLCGVTAGNGASGAAELQSSTASFASLLRGELNLASAFASGALIATKNLVSGEDLREMLAALGTK
jgi:thioester reductase-like protein/putative sterol carrier protein